MTAADPDDANNQTNAGVITPEVVRQVADKVYAMWLWDLKIEQERRRTGERRTGRRGDR